MFNDIPVFNSISHDLCCGCESCNSICPVDCIQMMPLGRGKFLYPQRDIVKCVKCNKCVSVCPALGVTKNNLLLTSYGGYAKKTDDVLNGSSGGFFGLVANAYLDLAPTNYVCAVIWDKDFKGTHHFCSNSRNDIDKMRYSKYVQSKKGYIYREIKDKLELGCGILFVGTPCEIWGLKKYLSKDYDKLMCIDFICQGPTSEEAMRQYVNQIEKKYHSKISDLNMRFTIQKWIPQYLKIVFLNGATFLRLFYKTSIGKALMYMQRPSCYFCKYHGLNRASDITLADFHGVKEDAAYYCSLGTSAIIINTKKGEYMLELVKNDFLLQPVDYEHISSSNPRLIDSWKGRPGSVMFAILFTFFGLRTANSFALFCRLKDKITKTTFNTAKKLMRKIK